MTFFYSLSIVFFLFLCLVLCGAILIQEGKGGGLGASFGGGDSSDSLFGTSTPDVLKKVTTWLAIAFVVSCIMLSFWTAALGRRHVNITSQMEQIEGYTAPQ